MVRFEHPATEKVYEALDMLAHAEKALQTAIRELPALIGDNEELRQTVISHFYWHEERIKPTWLAVAFGMKEGTRINKYAGQAILPRVCEVCQKEFELAVTSRAALKDVIEVTGYSPPREVRDTCPECLEIKKLKKQEQYSQHQEAMKAYEAQQQAHLEHLHTMPYREYLQTPEWQERRKRAMKRAGFRCQVCNAYGVRLNVHHRTYERRGYEHDRDLIVLCEGCHQIFHDNGSLAE